MIVAITGATGTLGRRLVNQHLEAGDLVRTLSRQSQPGLPPAVEVHRGDLASDSATLSRFADGADVLYHCAAEIRDPQRMMEVNVTGTGRLVSAARAKVRCWVQLGSIAVYGTPERGVITEETPPHPVDLYGRSKAEADQIVLGAAQQGGFAARVLRPAKVFGASIDSENNDILFRLFALIDRGLFFFIGEPGALTHYVHVDNVVAALIRCGRGNASGARVYNLSDDCPLERFVAEIAGALGKPRPTLRVPERPARWLARALGPIPGFPLNEKRLSALVNRASFPIARARDDLGYTHCVPVEAGIRALAQVWQASR